MQQDVEGSTDVACDDAVLLYLQYSTQWRIGGGHRRSRFLLTAPPLHLPGAVGSPVNPIAAV